jgi:hypothetical protein
VGYTLATAVWFFHRCARSLGKPQELITRGGVLWHNLVALRDSFRRFQCNLALLQGDPMSPLWVRFKWTQPKRKSSICLEFY